MVAEERSYGKVWLFFSYYWVIFGIACYLGQFIPHEWRKPLSIGLLILILINLVVAQSRKYGVVISHIYTIVIGLLSFATFSAYIQDFGTDLFLKNVLLAVSAFIAFGVIGFFVIKDASSMGKYLFVALIALVVGSLIGIVIHNPIFYTLITVSGLLLFLLYTLYDFNRMKQGHFSNREMGFNLFINLLNIIKFVLRLSRIFVKR